MTVDYELTEMQKSYLVGRYEKNYLGGVSCHVYMEIEAVDICVEKLENAWERVIKKHPALCASVIENKLVFNENTVNKKILVMDLRNEENQQSKLAEIRTCFSERILHIEHGHSCGLCVSLLDEKNSILHFDFDLIVGDVLSFYIIINDLEKIYQGKDNGETIAPFSVKQAEKELKPFYPEEWIASLPHYPILTGQADAENMYSCSYKTVRCDIDEAVWDNFCAAVKKQQKKVSDVLLAIFSAAVSKHTSEKDFLISVPQFNCYSETEEKAVFDRTSLKIIPINNSSEKALMEIAEEISVKKIRLLECDSSGINAVSYIREHYPERRMPAPVVFSEITGKKLISGRADSPLKKVRFLTAQTPQVCLDIQVYETGNEMFTCFIYPDKLYPDFIVESIAKEYKEQIKIIAEGK